MENERYYTKDASVPFLAPESVDLFLIHPPYFNGYSDPHGKPEGQLQNASSKEYFVNQMTKIIKHMEHALKPSGTIVIGMPTSEYMYKIIGKINTETNLEYGPLFFWDYTSTRDLAETGDPGNNIFLNLHKGAQEVNKDYKLDSHTLVHPWILSDELTDLSHLGHTHNSAPEIVYERIIGRYSKPGDVVADIMGGTGLVLAIAKKMNRETIYNDISDSQLRLAKYLIDGEEDETMKLNREEVINLMTKEIQDMNKLSMDQFNIPWEQQEKYMKESKPEFDKVNGMLFDMLVKNGVIQ